MATTPANTLASAPTKADAASTITVGQPARLKAVHGRLHHPYLKPEVVFDMDKSHKIEVDDWVKVQFDAGKLAIDD